METGLSDAVLKMYHNASGNKSYSSADVRREFSRVVINRPLLHYSRIAGKVATSRHILESELNERSIEELLAEV
ncbi:MAG: hypothetical protein FWD40_01030 [Treponema sp.]|nr:hypothetical protein [Treponema sp.]